jgi:hypothetical protein
MTRPLAIRLTLLLLAVEALLPLGVAGLIAVALSGDMVGGRQSYRFIGYAVLVSAWPFLTAMGVVGYRRWALFSILALAAMQSAVAAFCLGSDLGVFSKPTRPGHSPLEPVYLVLLTIGVWWLVHFSRRTTRILFVPTP